MNIDETSITIDIDWAKDKEIIKTSDVLIKNEVKSTWFVTHDSQAVQDLFDIGLFEFGLHPNFMADSTQGKTIGGIMEYLMAIVKSNTMRTHRLYQYTNLFKFLCEDYGIEVDVSIFLPETPNITPHTFNTQKSSIVRVPYIWEDDLEQWNGYKHITTYDKIFDTKGLKVFDFHPVHVYHDVKIHNFFNGLCEEISGKDTKTISEIVEGFKRGL